MLEKLYEILFIARPDKDEAQLSDTIAWVRNVLERNGARVIDHKVWGKRKLAYKIRHVTEGIYVLMEFVHSGANIPEIKRILHMSDDVIRFIIVKKPSAGKAPVFVLETEGVIREEPASAAENTYTEEITTTEQYEQS
jgi:small subunit ribosomal protein S6